MSMEYLHFNFLFKNIVQRALTACALFSAFALSNCTPESISPTSDSSSKVASQITVVDGRLRFATYEVFAKTRDQLSTATPAAIEKWEKSIGFASLRAGSYRQYEPAEALMKEFYFPFFYAAMINEFGEYQIGNTIFWFHQGYKYEARSEEELREIQINPALAKNKSEAGAVKLGKTPNPSSKENAQRTQDNGDPADARYQYQFPIQSPTGIANIIYKTYVYTEWNPLGPGFYTALYLVIDMQQILSGSSTWSTSQRGFYINLNLDLYANVQHTPGWWLSTEPRTTVNRHIGLVNAFGQAPYQVTLGDAVHQTAQNSLTTYTLNGVKWNYDLYGTIDTQALLPGGIAVETADPSYYYDPNGHYILTSGSNKLWP